MNSDSTPNSLLAELRKGSFFKEYCCWDCRNSPAISIDQWKDFRVEILVRFLEDSSQTPRHER